VAPYSARRSWRAARRAPRASARSNRASELMVFPRARLIASTEAILSDNDVRAQGSADMLKIWQGK